LFATCEDFLSAGFKSVDAPVIFTFGVLADRATGVLGFSVASPSDEALRRVLRPFSALGVSSVSLCSSFAIGASSSKCTNVVVPVFVG